MKVAASHVKCHTVQNGTADTCPRSWSRQASAHTPQRGGRGPAPEHLKLAEMLARDASPGLEYVLTALMNLEQSVRELTAINEQLRAAAPRLTSPSPMALAPEAPVLSVPTPGAPRVLHIDGDQNSAVTLATLLMPEARVTHAATMAEAQRLLASEKFALVVIDPELSDGDGGELLGSMLGTPVLMYAAQRPDWLGQTNNFLSKASTSHQQVWSKVLRMLKLDTSMYDGVTS